MDLNVHTFYYLESEEAESFHKAEEGKILQNNKYMNWIDRYGNSLEGVKQKLWARALYPDAYYDESPLLLQVDIVYPESEKCYFASPVLMSLIIEDYECTEKLLDAGYLPDPGCFLGNDGLVETQLYMERYSYNCYQFHELSITRWLFSNPDIPEPLLGRILDSLGEYRPVFNFDYDCWENPFYKKDIIKGSYGNYERIKLSWDFFEKIYRIRPELLEGMLGDSELMEKFNGPRGSSDGIDNVLKHLLKYFAGTFDVVGIIKGLGTLYFNSYDIGRWIRMLPRIKKSCRGNEEAEIAFINQMFNGLVFIASDHAYRMCHLNSDIEEQEKKIWRCLHSMKNTHYSQEDLMDYIWTAPQSLIAEYSYYILFWKSVYKGKWIPLRYDKAFVAILNELLEQGCGYTYVKLDRNVYTQRIQIAIGFIELLDGVSYEYCDPEECRGLQADFISMVLQTKNEELLKVCVEKNLIPSEQLGIVADAAVEFGYINLIPMITYLQTCGEEGGTVCIQ
ncbi:MAG: hypothetical protein IJ336_09045 [Lachnospiraceae bacterium]|nr:hypothetical protein [Lachnospiraceae bacterium]